MPGKQELHQAAAPCIVFMFKPCPIMKTYVYVVTVRQVIMVKQPYCLQRGKHQKGAHLGDGPIPYPATSKLRSDRHMQCADLLITHPVVLTTCWKVDDQPVRTHKKEVLRLLCGVDGSDNPESRVAKQYRWDAQGRRHKKEAATPRGNFYEEAMKVRK